MAVGPDGGVYEVARTATWPTRLEYEMVVRDGGGGEARYYLVRLRLRDGRDGKVGVSVAAWPVEAGGKPARDARTPRQRVDLDGGEGGMVAGMREMF
eukprot:4647908-Prymnesium_polylepis.1